MSLSYESSGVRYDQLDAFKRACQQAARATAGELASHGYAEPAEARGESAYLIEAADHYLAHVEAFAWKTPEEYRQKLLALSSPFCMNCTNPRCQEAGCPLAAHVPQWVQLAYQERWQEAADLLHRDNNFPEFTSILCPAFCQEPSKAGSKTTSFSR